MEEGDNQQDYILNNDQIQVIVSGVLGDGHLALTKSKKGEYSTRCIHKDYLVWKKDLLGEICRDKIASYTNKGYKENVIYAISTKPLKSLVEYKTMSIPKLLSALDEKGLAMWLYDDGSLHKKNHFFNLNTHSFTEHEHYEYFVPYFKKLGMEPKVFKDIKKDGRVFSYLYFGKHFGAFEISKILQKHYIDCYKYKMWSSEAIQKWSKLKVELKRRGIEVTPRKFTNILLGRSSI